MGQQLNRLTPAGHPSQYKTYSVSSPLETHTRPATCQEVDCTNYEQGWVTQIDLDTALGKNQAEYILNHAGRRYTLLKQVGSVVTLKFLPQQQCFVAHRVALDRPAFYLVRDGDWRGNPLGTSPIQRSPDDWVDDFANHQIKVADQIEKG